MGLPAISIPYGYVLVYGTGTITGIAGNQATNTDYRFATIYGVGVGMSGSLVGNSVCFLAVPEPVGMLGDNYPYLILKNEAIIATEVFL